MADLTGQVIRNRYIVHEFLGSGGMAEVYKVWDNERNSFLAMKVLHEKYARHSVVLEHFRREAENLAKLKHPNIVRFYGFEQDQTRSYILMDFIEGQTLKDKIKSKNGTPFGTEEISKLLSPVLIALQFAHNRDLIHCDIKPANIMVDVTGKVLLTDFGIARASYLDNHAMSSSGTPAYMAPEQVRNEAPVPETDIYALGVVLYEMLTGGTRPFNGTQAQTGGSTANRIRWEQEHLPHPSPYHKNPSLNPKLNTVLNRVLSKDISQRYHSAIELANALNSVEEASPAVQIPQRAQVRPSADEAKTAYKTTITKQRGQKAKELPPRKKAQSSNNGALWLLALFFIAAVVVTFTLVFSGGGGTSLGGSGIAGTSVAPIPPPPAATVERPAVATYTPFAKLFVRGYDQSRDADAVFIESDEVEELFAPGRTGGRFALPAGKKAGFLFGWCATEQGILAGNLAHIREEITIDNYPISLASFSSGQTQDTRGLWCKSYAAVITSLEVGEHTLIHTRHFDAPINDGMETYPAGSYVVEYSIIVE